MNEILSVVVLLGSGTTLGVFFAVAVSVAPALAAMPPRQYVETHQMLGKGYHPAMPIITNVTTFAGLALAVLAPRPLPTVLFAVGVVLIIGVQAVSHLGNVPINRALRTFDDSALDGNWTDPRPRWRGWHMVRTTLAAAALLVNSVAVIS